MPRKSGAHGPQRLGGESRVDLVVLCGVVALAAAILAAFAWTRPTAASSEVGYHQFGSLIYSAPTSSTSPYGTAGVQTRQPVYTQLVQTLSLTYTYRFTSTARLSIHGTEQLVATLSEGTAFTRTVPLQPPTTFTGDKFTATGTLHFATFNAMVAAFNKFTGGNGNLLSLSIAPHVTVNGRIGTVPVKAHFNQATKFGFSQSTLTPPASTQGESSQSAGTTASRIGHALTSSSSGSVTTPAGQQATLLAGLSVSHARLISLCVLALALAFGAPLARPVVQELRSNDERARIATKLNSKLVEVVSLPRPPGAVVALRSFAGLEQVSRQLECPVLHLRSETGDEYAVVDNGTVYLYEIPQQPAQRLSRVVVPDSDSPGDAASVRGPIAKRAGT